LRYALNAAWSHSSNKRVFYLPLAKALAVLAVLNHQHNGLCAQSGLQNQSVPPLQRMALTHALARADCVAWTRTVLQELLQVCRSAPSMRRSSSYVVAMT
jgi:hypothetical protein